MAHIRQISNEISSDKWVYYTDFIDHNDIFDTTYGKHLQQGNDLGIRMKNAFITAFHSGYRKVVLIGSDCYDLQPEDIALAFNELKKHDAVIGPALDGGYYLLGLKYVNPYLFINIPWGKETVFARTIEILDNSLTSYSILPSLRDIDDIEDLKMYPELNMFFYKN